MSQHLLGNLYLVTGILCSAASQVLIKLAVNRMEHTRWDFSALRQLTDLAVAVPLFTGGFLLILGFLFWLASLTRLDLSYAYPIACTSVLLVTLLSAVFLNETVTLRTWVGTLLILLGILALTPTSKMAGTL